MIPAERLWVNPDCGLKTRGWPETEAALANMVAAARILREKMGRPDAAPWQRAARREAAFGFAPSAASHAAACDCAAHAAN